jgi:hypothetical protein
MREPELLHILITTKLKFRILNSNWQKQIDEFTVNYQAHFIPAGKKSNLNSNIYI